VTEPDPEATAARFPRRLVAAACPEFPDLHDDWPLLRAALAHRGVEASAAVWSDPTVDWSAYDVVLANGAWDNIHHADEFLRWADYVSGSLGVTVVNPPAVLRWNIDKRYLRELEAAGVPVVPTMWVEPGTEAGTAAGRVARPDPPGRGPNSDPPLHDSIPDPAEIELPGSEIVVKPTVSGGGFQTARYRPHEHDEARRHLADLVRSGRTAMVQLYQPTVDDVGEVGLIFFGGTFSHAMHKDPMIRRGTGPRPNLIENQVVTPASASPAQVALGQAALAAAERLHGPVAYARVDTVEAEDGRPLLLELELLDPVLFFVTDPAGAERFAAVLASWPLG
jgi:glutathione synthase/RimK-type ligase-like ATP-grasp enzyme